jgi:hypothetical protein
VIRGRVQRFVPRIDGRVVDAPARQQRTLDLPFEATVVAPEQEQPFACANQGEDADRGTYLALLPSRHPGSEYDALAYRCSVRVGRRNDP